MQIVFFMLLIAALGFCFTAPSRDGSGRGRRAAFQTLDMKTAGTRIDARHECRLAVNSIFDRRRGERGWPLGRRRLGRDCQWFRDARRSPANALMIPQRARDKDWNFYSLKLAAAAQADLSGGRGA